MIARTLASPIGLVFKLFFLFLLIGMANKGVNAQEIPILPNLPQGGQPGNLKGLSPGELQNLMDDANKDKGRAGEDLNLKGLPQTPADTAEYRQTKTIDSTSLRPQRNVYGADIFQRKDVLQLTQLSTPPEDYAIGVGDHIIVSLWGGADFEQDYIVARDGTIFPRGLGKITLQGLTFKNARSILRDRFRRVVPEGTNISVTMGQPRSIVVQVTGNVANPGPVVVSAFTNVLNVVALAGGLNEHGNLRNILLSRNGKVIDSVDIYRYLNTGDFGKYLYLENNDFVIVPFYDKKVFATGQFKRPMYYQLKENEGIKDLTEYAGGFTSNAYTSGISIIRTINEKQVIKTVNLNSEISGDREPLFDGDVIAVNVVNPELQNKVLVKGELAYPGTYEVKSGDRLFDIINRAGGLTQWTFLDKAYVYKESDNLKSINSSRIDVDLHDFNKNVNSPSNIPIDPDDIIEVFSVDQFQDKQTVSILGEVRKPGQYTRYVNMSLKDLLYFANGLKPSAEYGNITITSVLEPDSTENGFSPTEITERTFNVNQNLALDKVTEDYLLRPFDQVIVRKNPNYQIQQNVRVQGRVLYPGTYPKLNADERLSSLVKRSGGILENGNPDGAILFRSSDSTTNNAVLYKSSDSSDINGFDPTLTHDVFKIDSAGRVVFPDLPPGISVVSINLEDALKNPGGKSDLELIKGDLLYIPGINNTVTVSGAVQNALKLTFDSKQNRIKYYIDKAGGFGVRPWRKRIFVTYPDGTSRKTRSFLFFHSYPKVVSGSVVIVPQRNESKGLGDSIVSSILGSIPLVVVYLLTRSRR